MTKPPEHALPLLEALKAYEDWGEGGLVPDFLCQDGEWQCWARRGKPDGPWVKLPIEAWAPNPHIPKHWIIRPGELKIVTDQLIVRNEHRYEERVPLRHPETGAKIFVVEQRVIEAERWHRPVFAPVAREEEVSRPTAMQAFADWREWERQRDPKGHWPERSKRRAVGKSLGLRQKDYDPLPTPGKRGRR